MAPWAQFIAPLQRGPNATITDTVGAEYILPAQVGAIYCAPTQVNHKLIIREIRPYL